MTQILDDIQRIIFKARRPGLLVANACFLLAGAGLVLLNEFSYPLITAIYRLFGDISQAAALFWVDAVYYAPCLLLPCILIARKYDPLALRLEPVMRGHGIMSVLAALVCIPVVNSVAILWSILLEWAGIPVSETQIVIEDAGELAVAVFAMGVMPGICEELMFRGVMLRAYEGYGRRKSIAVSAVLFAVLHGSLQGLPGQLLMGLVLGGIVVSSGSIYTGMMIHTAYNSLLLIISYAQGMDSATAGLSMLEQVGGAPGVVAVTLQGAIMGLLLWAIMRYFRRNCAMEHMLLPNRGENRMGIAESLVLLSGAVTALYLYLADIMNMLGYA